MAGVCPNCGGELKKKVTTESGADIAPEGGVLVCANCFQAVAPDEAVAAGSTASPPPNEPARGIPGPPRPEDEISTEAEDFVPAPTTSPEVAAEETPEDDALN